MCEIEPDSEASRQELLSERPVRTAVLAISAGMTRCAVRIVCMRLHDVAGVLTVEVDSAGVFIRVTGTMDTAELVAVIDATESEVT
jgi:hypothetical protein